MSGMMILLVTGCDCAIDRAGGARSAQAGVPWARPSSLSVSLGGTTRLLRATSAAALAARVSAAHAPSGAGGRNLTRRWSSPAGGAGYRCSAAAAHPSASTRRRHDRLSLRPAPYGRCVAVPPGAATAAVALAAAPFNASSYHRPTGQPTAPLIVPACAHAPAPCGGHRRGGGARHPPG